MRPLPFIAAAIASLITTSARAEDATPAAEIVSPPTAASAPVTPCVLDDRIHRPFATCFDPGNRLRFTMTNAGLGAGIDLRHRVQTDDRTIHYRLEHTLLDGTIGPSRYALRGYAMRFVRHSDRGSLVIPTNPPTQIHLPLDLGAETSFAGFSGDRHDRFARASVVRLATFADLARSTTGRYRLAIGPAVRWDATADRVEKRLLQHQIAPFTVAALSLYAESEDGLTLARLDVDAGVTRGEAGYRRLVVASTSIERVLIALNDQPISAFVGASYDDPGSGLLAFAGLRFALFSAAR